MSFREFLPFERAMEVSPIPLPELLSRHAVIAMRLTSDVKILPLFEKNLKFGRDYIIPTPFDPRLKEYVASAVSKAAVDSGVSRMM